MGGKFSLDVPGPLTVEVTDTNQKTIYQQKLELSPFGSFHGTLTLSPLAALGTYGITAHIGDKQTLWIIRSAGIQEAGV